MNNKKLDLQWFIEQHSDWEKLLSEKPYCITISRDVVDGRRLIMFKYSQIDSDFNIKLVRECRGIVLNEDTFEPVVVPFFKFGNYGESYCPNIDWKNCWVGQKIDGSLIKVVKFKKGLLISTNGTIDAFKASLPEQIGCPAKSFGDLFCLALQNAYHEYQDYSRKNHLACFDWILTSTQWLSTLLKEGQTYMFELTSPYNKVVVGWSEIRAFFLGVRDNTTLEETYFTDHSLSQWFKTPKVFPLRSVDECIAAAEKLGTDEEGIVVCDKQFNRVKIKSPTYVALHHMKNNGVLSYERGIEIVRGNELGEVLTYFPEFKEHLEKIKERYDEAVADIRALEKKLNDWIADNGYATQHWLIENGGKDRKKLAMWLFTATKNPGVGFAIVDGKIATADDWLKSMPSSKLVSFLGFKD